MGHGQWVGDLVHRTHELHGVPVGTFGGRLEDFTTLVHADDLGRLTDLIQGAIRDRLPYEVEFRVIHPDGSVHWLATAGRALYEPDGRPTRMLGVTWERTQQRLEEETARACPADGSHRAVGRRHRPRGEQPDVGGARLRPVPAQARPSSRPSPRAT